MANKANIELIDRYLLNELTEEELKKIEIQRMVDADFENELRIAKDINKGIEYAANQDLLQVLDKIHYKHITKNRSSKPNKKIIYVGILCLILSAMLIWVYKSFVNSTETPNKIFAAYYNPYIPSLDTRGSSNPQIVEAFSKLYYQNEFSAAVELIEPSLNSVNDELKLLSAICYIELDKNDKAVNVLNTIIENNSYYFIDHAHWFSALAKIKLGQIEEVKGHLQFLIGKADADHKEEALKLFKEVN